MEPESTVLPRCIDPTDATLPYYDEWPLWDEDAEREKREF